MRDNKKDQQKEEQIKVGAQHTAKRSWRCESIAASYFWWISTQSVSQRFSLSPYWLSIWEEEEEEDKRRGK
jgi:hypothetical protein